MNPIIHSRTTKEDKKKLPGNNEIQAFKEQPSNHHNFNCKKTMYNDVDAGVLFSVFTTSIINERSTFKR